jgi:hypothetical protein
MTAGVILTESGNFFISRAGVRGETGSEGLPWKGKTRLPDKRPTLFGQHPVVLLDCLVETPPLTPQFIQLGVLLDVLGMLVNSTCSITKRLNPEKYLLT